MQQQCATRLTEKMSLPIGILPLRSRAPRRVFAPLPQLLAFPKRGLPVYTALLVILLALSPVFADPENESGTSGRLKREAGTTVRGKEMAGAPRENGKLDINTAEAAELETLPRIGPARAKAIVDHRDSRGPFEKTEDILKVHGIGPQTFAVIRDRIRVSLPESPPTEDPDRREVRAEALPSLPAAGGETGEPPPEEEKLDINTATAE